MVTFLLRLSCELPKFVKEDPGRKKRGKEALLIFLLVDINAEIAETNLHFSVTQTTFLNPQRLWSIAFIQQAAQISFTNQYQWIQLLRFPHVTGDNDEIESSFLTYSKNCILEIQKCRQKKPLTESNWNVKNKMILNL